jgi:hypothetical protein
MLLLYYSNKQEIFRCITSIMFGYNKDYSSNIIDKACYVLDS